MNMEFKDKKIISDLCRGLMSREEVRLLIPMGYVPGLPILSVRNDQLVAVFPFLRYKVTGEVDRTLVFPVRYTMEFLVPEKTVTGFRDLSLESDFAGQNFNEVIGFFRHKAVRNLDRDAYNALKTATLSGYDALVNSLFDETCSFDRNDEAKFRVNLRTLVEPFVVPTYKKLDIDFYNKYLK